MTSTPSGPDDPSGSGSGDGDNRFDPYRFGAPDPEQNQTGWASGGNQAANQPGNQTQPWGQGQQGGQPAGYGYSGAGQPGGGQPGGGQGPGGYGAPAYPPSGYPSSGYAPQPQSGRNGFAIAGMVLGIISIPLFFLTIIDIVIGILALIFAGIGLAKSRRGRGKGMSIAGLICGVIGVIASIVFLVVAYNLAKDCLDKYNRNSDQYQQCVNDKIVGLPLTGRK